MDHMGTLTCFSFSRYWRRDESKLWKEHKWGNVVHVDDYDEGDENDDDYIEGDENVDDYDEGDENVDYDEGDENDDDCDFDENVWTCMRFCENVCTCMRLVACPRNIA